MTIKVYGIPNCSTVKKARTWLEDHGVNYEFFDYKKHAPTHEQLLAWLAIVDLNTLLNRKGTTWRTLTPDQQSAASDSVAAIELMIAKPSLIKRPVLEHINQLLVGFDEKKYADFFN